MPNFANIIEAAAAGGGLAGAAAGALYRPVIRRRARKMADDLFLHGTAHRPGLPDIEPAGDRVMAIEGRLDGHDESIVTHTNEIATLVTTVQQLAESVAADRGSTKSGGQVSSHERSDRQRREDPA